MVNISYANAYKEVLVIIKNLVKEDYEKIPTVYIEYLEKHANQNYSFDYDNSKTFSEQDLLDDTKYILFGLFEKFGATEIQKNKIKSFKTSYYNKLEKQKREKYNPEDLFRNKQCNNKITEQQATALVEYKEPKWYQKIFDKILSVFKR